MSKTALNAARAANQSKKVERLDLRVAATVREVHVNVVAELGRIKFKLGDLAKLRVGDTLRLDVPVDGDVDVRIESEVLFKGQPRTVGSQIAIQLTARKEPDVPPRPEPAPRLPAETPDPRGRGTPPRR